ncbi:MAG: hypothetical protein KBS85_06630, partial [Lachnospiraceae bacterium]|nr:hypothetical protein [Candidatus Merdinaster equi]
FPVRVQPNWLGGYGYATSVFYGDLFLYFPAMLRICGFTIQDAYASYVLVITAGTAIISYYCMKGVFQSSKLGLLLSGAYTLSAYRLFLTFALTRCGMYTAYMLLPLVVYGVYRIFKTPKTGGWVYLSIAMTGILQTHLLSAEMTALGIFITILMLLKDFLKNRVWLTFIKAVGISILINIGFLIPIAEFYLSGNYYCNAAGWDEKWNYIQKGGVEISSLGNVFNQDLTRDSEIIDILLLGAAISFLIFMIIVGKKLIAEELKCYKKIGIVSSIACLIFTYMGTMYFPWDFIEETMPFLRGIINSVQYPQRFFSVGTVLGLVSLGCLVKMVAGYREGRYKRYLLIAIGVLVLIPALWKISLFASESDAKKVYSTAALDSYNISTKEYLPFGCNPDELVNELPYSESVVISSFERRGLHLTMSLFNPSDRDELVEVPLVYYPHYAATGENSRAIELLESENHTVVASLPAGYSGTVSVAFKTPIMWIIGDVVSELTCLGIVVYFAMLRKCKRQNTPNLLNK